MFFFQILKDWHLNSLIHSSSQVDLFLMALNLFKTLQQNEPTSPDPCLVEPLRRPTVHSFYKVLTASDKSTYGGFFVLRKHATECLPQLVIFACVMISLGFIPLISR